MHDYVKILLISFLVTAASTPVIIKLAFRVRFLDVPGDDPLKIHRRPVPLLGGLGITLASLAGLLVGAGLFHELRSSLPGIGGALLLLFLMGLYDDRRGLSPHKRLAVQTLAALGVALVAGVTVNLVANEIINIFITVFYVVILINAMNLLDGMDGLASGIALVAAAGFLVGFGPDQSLGILLSMTLIGASAGFLIYNYAPARIFLGDSGSTVLGFLLGVSAVVFSSRPASGTPLIVSALILIVPISDTALTVIRRLKGHARLFHGDREHLYDQLLRLGLSQRQTTALMCGFGAVGALIAILLSGS